MSLLQEFKDFALKGNAIDLAIGVIIGSVFSKVVSSLVSDVIMPPIGLLIGGVDFSDLALKLSLPGSYSPPVELKYGAFINNVIDFLIISGVIFTCIKFINSIRPPTKEPSKQQNCPYCKMAIPVQAKKCGHCCSIL